MGTLVLAGRYEIVEKIGDGGMAVVYKARDKQLNRFVAIKILKKEFISDQIFVENFINEAKAATSLLHPNIVTIYDAGKDRDIYYIVMEYVEGKPLSDVIQTEAPLDYKRCIRIGKQVASALLLAHRNNIIHRDVKPHNILITPDGTAKITDFGIAKAVSDGTIINDSGIIMGSVHYFSPEQSRGQYVDEKSDIYSLGIVLYEMITGRVPFDADNPVTIAVMHMNDTIIPPSRLVKGVPPGLDQIVMKATAKYQSDRFGDIDEMYKALDNINFITGIIDDPIIAGFVAPTNIVEEDPGHGYSSATPPDDIYDDSYDADDDFIDLSEPDYEPKGRSAVDDVYDSFEDDEDEVDRKRGGFFAAGAAGAAAHEVAKDFDDEKEKKDGKGKTKLTKNQKIILIVAAIAVAIAVSFPLSNLLMGLFSSEPVEVPDVVGLYVEEATDILTEAGFSSEIEIIPLPPIPKQYVPAAGEDTTEMTIDEFDENYNTNNYYEPDFLEGQVMDQDPEGGSMVKAGSTVKLKVAGPPEEVEDDPDALGEPTEVPDLLGKTKANAEYAIKTAGFQIGLVGYENSEEPIDTVIDQSPKAGEMAPGNSRIAIVISLGPREELVQVPNLVGMTESQAQNALQSAGLRYQRGNNVDAKNVNEIDKAVAQRPAANTNAKKNEVITVDFGIGFTVTFINGLDNSVIRADLVIRGATIAGGQFPPLPAVAGYTFAWNAAQVPNIQNNVSVTAVPTAIPPTFNLVVVYGNATGPATGLGPSANVGITSDPGLPDPGNKWVFGGWSISGGGSIANPNAPDTSVTMPASGPSGTVTVTASWSQEPE